MQQYNSKARAQTHVLDESAHSVMGKHSNNDANVLPASSTKHRLCVFGNCLQDENRRQFMLHRLQASRSKQVRFSGVESAADLTLLLELTQQNPCISHVELLACELSSRHFEILPTNTTLISCRLHQEVTPAALDTSCAANTQVTKLHIQDLIMDSSLSAAVSSFRQFPALQSFQLVACHLSESSYFCLATLLKAQHLRSLAVDLRVWNEDALQRTGLTQAMGAHEGLTELRFNGRLLEQVETDTLVALCGGPSPSNRRRLRLTYRPEELRKGGDQLGRLVEMSKNLRAIDIAEFENVTSLSSADNEKTLASLIAAVGASTTIESLMLPKLSSDLSQQLAKALSSSPPSLQHVSARQMVWSRALTMALRQNSKLVHFSAGSQKDCHHRFVHECVQRNLRLPQLLADSAAANSSSALLPHMLAASQYSHSTAAVQVLVEMGDFIGAVATL